MEFSFSMIFDFHKSFKLLIDITLIRDMENGRKFLPDNKFFLLLFSAQSKFLGKNLSFTPPYLREVLMRSLAAINFCVVRALLNKSFIFIAREQRAILNRLLTLADPPTPTVLLPISRKYDFHEGEKKAIFSLSSVLDGG